MKETLLRFKGVVFLTIVVILFGSATALTYNSMSSILSKQVSQIADLESRITLKEQSVQQAEATAVRSVTGLDANRVLKDNVKAEELFRSVMTWDSLAQYNQIRLDISEMYDIKETNSFLSIFMPEVVETESPDGTKYNRIDTLGLNVNFEDMETYCTGIRNTTYSYAAFVSFSSTSSAGNEGFANVMATYDVDADGNISNLNAYTVKESR